MCTFKKFISLKMFSSRTQNCSINAMRDDRMKHQIGFASIIGQKKFVKADDNEYSDVEIEDIEEQEVETDYKDMQDIDINNISKPLNVSRYAERIFINDQKEEEQFIIPLGTFESVQEEITPKMREILVKWLINVHHEFNFSSETLFNAIAYLDQVLAKKSIRKNRLQLVGSVCLWMAAKVEEIRIPSVNELIELCNEPYTQAQFCRYEAKIISILNFRLQFPTIKGFLRRYLMAVSASSSLIEIASFMCEAALLDHRCVSFRPSAVALAIIASSILSSGSMIPKVLLKKYSHFQNMDEVKNVIPIVIDSTNLVLAKKTGASYQRYTDSSLSGAVLSLNLDENHLKKLLSSL